MAEVTKQDRTDAQAIYNAYRKSGVPCKGAEMVAAIREQAREAAEKAERQAVVDWLEHWNNDTMGQDLCPDHAVKCISRGDHRKG